MILGQRSGFFAKQGLTAEAGGDGGVAGLALQRPRGTGRGLVIRVIAIKGHQIPVAAVNRLRELQRRTRDGDVQAWLRPCILGLRRRRLRGGAAHRLGTFPAATRGGGNEAASASPRARRLHGASGNVLPICPLETGHGGDAEDPGGADGDARLHRGLLTDAEQTNLPHVTVAVANPNLVGAFRAAVAGRRTRKLQGSRRWDELGHSGMMQELSAPGGKPTGMERTVSSAGCLNPATKYLHPAPRLHDGDGLEELWVQAVFAGSWENEIGG